MYKRKLKTYIYIISGIATIFTLYVSGFFAHLHQVSFNEFSYPLNGDIFQYVEELKNHQRPSHAIINQYNYKFIINPEHKCQENTTLRLVYVIKSSLEHFERREMIRRTWGFEKRFSDVEIRTFFMLGAREDVKLQDKVLRESSKFKDLIQADFLDAYFNNTIKTLMSFKWLINYCPYSKFYMFVDDDYYVSTKNVLRYLNNPSNYPKYLKNSGMENVEPIGLERFYAGYSIPATPMRNLFSKFSISLKEYPYDKFPLYATAGAYIMSLDALVDMFYASNFVKHFRFDDVYLGIVAYKIGIKPVHTDYITLFFEKYTREHYEFMIAVHGYDDSKRMEEVWMEQKEIGNA